MKNTYTLLWISSISSSFSDVTKALVLAIVTDLSFWLAYEGKVFLPVQINKTLSSTGSILST
jgi:hypothetical protein